MYAFISVINGQSNNFHQNYGRLSHQHQVKQPAQPHQVQPTSLRLNLSILSTNIITYTSPTIL